MSYDNNDPRLTAYVLDELDDAKEHAAIDEASATDPALRTMIDELSNASHAIDRALLADDGLSLTGEQREQIQSRATEQRPRLITRGRIVFGAVAALAACMLIALVFTEVRYQPRIAVSKMLAPAEITGGPTSAQRQSAPTPVSKLGVSQSRETDDRLRDLGYVKPVIAEQATPTIANKPAPAPLQGEPSAFGYVDESSVATNGSSANTTGGPDSQPSAGSGLQDASRDRYDSRRL